jgi:hypothetical protein
MKIHVLAGDSLLRAFKKTNIEGEIIVCRECFVDGDLKAENPEDFWNVRANFIKKTYGENTESYRQNVYAEFEKLQKLPENSEVYLWFEYELFCQVNLWFCLWLLRDKNFEFYRVAPAVRNEREIWKGFGGLGANELKECFAQRIMLSQADVTLGKELWKVFCFGDTEGLKSLSENESESFPKLKEVCRAAIEIKSRPKEKLQQILSLGETDFKEIFKRFAETEGIYGFGDAQVKRIMQEI